MPVTKSAVKKLNQDKLRHKRNLIAKNLAKEAVKKYLEKPTEKLLREAYSALDRALKKNIYHRNKIARLKSSLSVYLVKSAKKKKTSK